MEFLKRFISSLILIPFVFFFIIKGSVLFNFFLFSIFCISCYEWYKMSKNKKYFLIGNLFLIFSFFTVYSIKTSNTSDSIFAFIFIISVCISTDIGGYVFGNIFKGPKLTKISPKKTYSGVVGSYVLSILTIFFLTTYSNSFINTDIFFDKYLIIATFFISTSSQLGDIFISYLKRLSNIKDTGKIIPGHGGILDRIDGMIFAFPFYYILNLFIKF
jgi:phosphatidate cytidylyltransferase